MHDVRRKPLLPRRTIRLVCLAAIVLMLLGCGRSGPKHWPVSGKVTFRGEPVAVGLIRFSNPQAGVDIVAELDADGEYAIVTGEKKGLPEGIYQVAVMPDVKSINVKTTPGGLVLPSSMPSVAPPNIPERYHDPASSGLTMTVEPESNTFDVDMRSGK